MICTHTATNVWLKISTPSLAYLFSGLHKILVLSFVCVIYTFFKFNNIELYTPKQYSLQDGRTLKVSGYQFPPCKRFPCFAGHRRSTSARSCHPTCTQISRNLETNVEEEYWCRFWKLFLLKTSVLPLYRCIISDIYMTAYVINTI